MRLIMICLALLLVAIQYPLWLGKGGWLRVWDLERQVASAQKKNDELKARNDKLDSEVRDLREGTEAVEERARYELGMIKDNEIFIQVLQPNGKAASAAEAAPAAAVNVAMPAAAPAANATAPKAATAAPAAKPPVQAAAQTQRPATR